MIRAVALALAACLALSGCGKIAGALLSGGGPNVAANVQAGKTNTQSLGATSNTDQTIERAEAGRIQQSADASRVKADRVETVNVAENATWLILAFAAALFLDSPVRWPGQIYRAISGDGRRSRSR